MTELFNVCQFFVDGSYEYVRREVTDRDAAVAFAHYCTSVGAQMGTTVRVIITDMDDRTCAEWQDGRLRFPPLES